MKKILLIILLLLSIILIGCNRNEPEEGKEEIVIIEEKEDVESIAEVKSGIPSPLSGIYAPEVKVNRRPVAVMFDNHPRARWQAGLAQALDTLDFIIQQQWTN